MYLIAESATHAGLSLEQNLGELVDEGTQGGESVLLHGLWLAGLQEVEVEVEDALHCGIVSVLELHRLLQQQQQR